MCGTSSPERARVAAFLAHADEHGGPLADVRLRSYREGLAANGMAELVRPVADSRSDAAAPVRDLLRHPRPSTALLSATDRAAVDGIWAARDLGVTVPGGLAVIGIGDIPEGLMISPPLRAPRRGGHPPGGGTRGAVGADRPRLRLTIVRQRRHVAASSTAPVRTASTAPA